MIYLKSWLQGEVGWFAVDSTQRQDLRVESRPECMLCGAEGVVLYRDQTDRLYCTPGLWTLKRCLDSACGLIWLDPTPIREDIVKAYAGYYTHVPQLAPGDQGRLRRAYRVVRDAYLARRYGYESVDRSLKAFLMGSLLYAFPGQRQKVEAGVRFIPGVRDGRLLDVGCGSGDWLASMQGRGWNVIGVDFDQHAVSVARGRGIDVRQGGLEEQSFPTSHFDAVTLNHVLEHVPDPIGTLSECWRVLKHEGILVLFTPNSGSLGHGVFRRDWRGLEPPRHLQIFRHSSMKALLVGAGFTDHSVSTANSRYVWRHSGRLWANRGAWVPVVMDLCFLLELVLLFLMPKIGESLVVIARKTRDPQNLGESGPAVSPK